MTNHGHPSLPYPYNQQVKRVQKLCKKVAQAIASNNPREYSGLLLDLADKLRPIVSRTADYRHKHLNIIAQDPRMAQLMRSVGHALGITDWSPSVEATLEDIAFMDSFEDYCIEQDAILFDQHYRRNDLAIMIACNMSLYQRTFCPKRTAMAEGMTFEKVRLMCLAFEYEHEVQQEVVENSPYDSTRILLRATQMIDRSFQEACVALDNSMLDDGEVVRNIMNIFIQLVQLPFWFFNEYEERNVRYELSQSLNDIRNAVSEEQFECFTALVDATFDSDEEF